MRRLLVLLAAVLCMGAASDPAERLPDPAQEARARALFEQVRCVVCQNESIDDSEAELAADLRAVVREQVAAGRSDAEIKAFLVERYGDFVLLRPPLRPGTVVLWGAPFLLLLAAGAALALMRRRPPPPEPALTPEEEAALAGIAAPASLSTNAGPTKTDEVTEP